MIYGEAVVFEKLMERLGILLKKFKGNESHELGELHRGWCRPVGIMSL